MARLVALASIGLLGLPTHAQAPTQEFVEPDVPFDEAATRAALEPGEVTLRGVAVTTANVPTANLIKFFFKEYPAAVGTTVTLYPVTPYFEAWLAMRERFGKGPKLAVMSPLAHSYRIVGRVAQPDGQFEFRNLKPGRYYLEAVVAFHQQLSEKRQTGSVETFNFAGQHMGSWPVYTRFRWTQADRNVVGEMVDIRSSSGVVTMKLK